MENMDNLMFDRNCNGKQISAIVYTEPENIDRFTQEDNKLIIFDNTDFVDSTEENDTKRVKTFINNLKSKENLMTLDQFDNFDSFRIIPKECTFSVQKTLLFQSKFHLHQRNNHLLTARRKLLKSDSLFYFFNSQTKLSTKDESYLGSMQSNFYGTQYNIYNKNEINLAYIIFNMKKNHPITISIFIPKSIYQNNKIPIKTRLLKNDPNIIEIISKQPKYDAMTKEYYLDLMGKGGMASKKNCILEYQDEMIALFSKQKQKNYHFQFAKPMLDIVAFGFAIAQYEEKIGNVKK